MVSVCLPADALSHHLPSYLGFSYLGRGVSLHSCSSKVQPLLLTLDEGYLLTAAPPDLEHGVAPLGPSAPAQPLLLGRGVACKMFLTCKDFERRDAPCNVFCLSFFLLFCGFCTLQCIVKCLRAVNLKRGE